MTFDTHDPSPITHHPNGIVTFLFTDIEGSTRLWERDSAVMRRALERHNAILSAAIADHGGYHFKTIGDAFQAAFVDPSAAVAAAVEAQHALEAEPWEETGPLRVRMALHLGPAEIRSAGDYVAPSLHRLARLLSAGHGGQVLLSSDVQAAVAAHLPRGVSAVSLGSHHLRDVPEPEEIWQLVIPGVPAHFPPLKSLQTHPTNLPPQPPLIGRDAEIAALSDLLDDEGTHVVTLTGPGGVGKTRLALAAATEALRAFDDGAFLVALSGIEDASLLLPEIAAVLGVHEGGGLTLEEAVLAYLGGKRLLLVLDNLEQLEPFEAAAALVGQLLTMRVMATSRAPLRIRAEREWPVAPLPVPSVHLELAGGEPEALAALAANPAVALFIERARAARPAWRLTPANARDVAELARRLDGLPLAIELAAARITVLTPGAIVARLGEALDLLAAGSAGVPDRQQTLRATIAWSHELLSFEEQVAFRRLAVFAGGFTLEAAEKVLATAPDPWIDALDAIAILTEQSLLQMTEDADGQTRYRMLETIRAFALEQLAAAGEEPILRRSHAEWAEGFARQADTHVLGAEGAAWLERFEREHDNLRVAMAWAIAHEPDELGLRATEANWRFWEMRGHYAEGRRWLEQALAACSDAAPKWRALTLEGLAAIAKRQGDLLIAATAYEEALGIWRETDNRLAASATLTNLGGIAERMGDFARALALQEEALAIARELGDALRVANILNNLALAVWNNGDAALARRYLEESAEVKRREGNLGGLAISLSNLGALAAEAGDVEQAITRFEEALVLDRQLGNIDGIADSLSNLADLIALRGDTARAGALAAEALTLRRDLGDKVSMVYSMEGVASIAARAGSAADGARIFGAADRLRTELGAKHTPAERVQYEAGMTPAREALSEAAFARAWAAGRDLALDDAVAEALRVARQIAQPLANAG